MLMGGKSVSSATIASGKREIRDQQRGGSHLSEGARRAGIASRDGAHPPGGVRPSRREPDFLASTRTLDLRSQMSLLQKSGNAGFSAGSARHQAGWM